MATKQTWNDGDKSLKFFYGLYYPKAFNVRPEEDELDIFVSIDYHALNNTNEIVDNQTYEGKIKSISNNIDESMILVDDEAISGNNLSTEISVSEYSNSSFTKIIEWSSKYPAIKIMASDIALLKDFPSFPPNQFVILRRFDEGVVVPHNLFKISHSPISTLIGYYNLLDTPVSFSMNERWITESDGFWEVLQDLIGIKFDSIPGLGDMIGKAGQNPIAQDMMMKIGQKLGFISENSNPYGEANLIYEAARRAVDGEEIESGLESNFSYTFETTYEYRQIGLINGKNLLKAQITKALTMGTNSAKFLSTGKGAAVAQSIFNTFATGDIEKFIKDMMTAMEKIVEDVKDYLGGVLFGGSKDETDGTGETDGTDETNSFDFADSVKNVVTELGKALGALAKMRYDRYKWKIRGVMGTMTGMHTAPWHLTFGNPMSPWFNIGNLILKDLKVEPTGELMYDDFPNEWKVTATLESGRAMGKEEIFECFNGSSQRVPANKKDLDKILNILAPEGSTVKIGKDLIIPPPGQSVTEEEKIRENDTQNNPEAINPGAGEDSPITDYSVDDDEEITTTNDEKQIEESVESTNSEESENENENENQ